MYPLPIVVAHPTPSFVCPFHVKLNVENHRNGDAMTTSLARAKQTWLFLDLD
jgi:hypothetical protein